MNNSNKNIEKNFMLCETCGHFLQHYVKRGLEFTAIYGGHCNRRNVNYNYKNRVKECEFWEAAAIIKQKRREKIKETLRTMSDRLEEIALILKDEKD